MGGFQDPFFTRDPHRTTFLTQIATPRSPHPLQQGACFRDNCRYAHSSQDGSQPAAQANQPICRDFQNGRCFRARSARTAPIKPHLSPPGVPTNHPTARTFFPILWPRLTLERSPSSTVADSITAPPRNSPPLEAAAAVGVSAATFAALGGQQLLMPQVDAHPAAADGAMRRQPALKSSAPAPSTVTTATTHSCSQVWIPPPPRRSSRPTVTGFTVGTAPRTGHLRRWAGTRQRRRRRRLLAAAGGSPQQRG